MKNTAGVWTIAYKVDHNGCGLACVGGARERSWTTDVELTRRTDVSCSLGARVVNDVR